MMKYLMFASCLSVIGSKPQNVRSRKVMVIEAENTVEAEKMIERLVGNKQIVKANVEDIDLLLSRKSKSTKVAKKTGNIRVAKLLWYGLEAAVLLGGICAVFPDVFNNGREETLSNFQNEDISFYGSPFSREGIQMMASNLEYNMEVLKSAASQACASLDKVFVTGAKKVGEGATDAALFMNDKASDFKNYVSDNYGHAFDYIYTNKHQ